MASGEDLHALFQAEVVIGVQSHHGQHLHLAVEVQPVLMLEGGLAVVGEERQIQSAGMAADIQTAGGGHRIAIGVRTNHGVGESALVGAVQAGVLGDEGHQLLQGEVGLIVLGLIKPLAVIQQGAAKADHILLGAEGADAGAIGCRHGESPFGDG